MSTEVPDHAARAARDELDLGFITAVDEARAAVDRLSHHPYVVVNPALTPVRQAYAALRDERVQVADDLNHQPPSRGGVVMYVNMVLVNAIYAAANVRCGTWTLVDLDELAAGRRER